MSAAKPAVVGVDVGSAEVRAVVFDLAGRALAVTRCPLASWSPGPRMHEQSSAVVWSCVASCVKQARDVAGDVRVAGIGFAATCSMVLVPRTGGKVSLSADDAVRDIIMWMDQRASAEAAAASASGAEALAFLGGRVSPEHQVPKLGWLAANRPDVVDGLACAMDLCDWLAWRATGATAPENAPRSQCATVCKWGAIPRDGGTAVCGELYRAAGAERFLAPGMVTPADGRPPLPVGAALPGAGLAPEEAAAMGLPAGIPVAAGLIDAHSGALACAPRPLQPALVPGDGAPAKEGGACRRGAGVSGPSAAAGGLGEAVPGLSGPQPADCVSAAAGGSVVVVAGTSACIMALAAAPASEPPAVSGVWGPFWGAAGPGRWLLEGGLSSAGAAIDRLLRAHAAFAAVDSVSGADPAPEGGAGAGPVHAAVFQALECRLKTMAAAKSMGDDDLDLLAESLHVCTDLAGNRSPFQSAQPLGVVAGMGMAAPDTDDLALLYLAAVQGVAHGVALVIHHIAARGRLLADEVILTGGGLASSGIFRRALAGACGVKVCVAPDIPAVPLGAAMSAASASGLASSIGDAQSAMVSARCVIEPPASAAVRSMHRKKSAVLDAMLRAMLCEAE